MSEQAKFFALARGAGAWISDVRPEITPPMPAEGQALEPPRRKPGRTRKSPENPPVAEPAGKTDDL